MEKLPILGYVRKTSDANVVDVTDKALAVFDRAEENMSGNVRITVMEDGASFIRGTIANLQNTITFGAVFVSIIVFAFLRRWEPTFIVSLSIPASMIVTFLVVYACGYTLNSVTLIGLSLSVGMVVDNGVVALENISRKLDEGLSPKDAAFQGASEVGGALLAFHNNNTCYLCSYDFYIGNCRSNVCTISRCYDCHHLCQSICCFDLNTYFGLEATQANYESK